MTKWDSFFKEKCTTIFSSSKEVIDIGGSLRLDTGKSNRVDAKNFWLKPLVENVSYKILDPVPDYNPDIVGDVHNLPFDDNSRDAILCLAVLEHVKNPILAMQELYRVLRPEGKLLIYVPFLYYYHADKGYYGDYWRFTSDTLKLFAEPFSSYELMPVRLPVETVIRITPLGRFEFIIQIARFIDKVFYSNKSSEQVSGYYLYLVK